jgi:hypothetical protein
MRERPAYTYFISDGAAIKIGYSKQPGIRIASLQTGTSARIEVLLVVPESVISEVAAHAKFDHLRIRGEWFKSDPEILGFIDGIRPQPNPVQEVGEPQIVLKEGAWELRALAAAYERADDYNKPAIAWTLRRLHGHYLSGDTR